jgi:hypothetical protein
VGKRSERWKAEEDLHIDALRQADLRQAEEAQVSSPTETARPTLNPRPEPKEDALYFDDLPVGQKTEILMDFSRAWGTFIYAAKELDTFGSVVLVFYTLGGYPAITVLMFSFWGLLACGSDLLMHSSVLRSHRELSAVIVLLSAVTLGFAVGGILTIRKFARYMHDKEVEIYQSIFGSLAEESSNKKKAPTVGVRD